MDPARFTERYLLSALDACLACTNCVGSGGCGNANLPGEHLSSEALRGIEGQAFRVRVRGRQIEPPVDAGFAQRHRSVVVCFQHFASLLKAFQP